MRAPEATVAELLHRAGERRRAGERPGGQHEQGAAGEEQRQRDVRLAAREQGHREHAGHVRRQAAGVQAEGDERQVVEARGRRRQGVVPPVARDEVRARLQGDRHEERPEHARPDQLEQPEHPGVRRPGEHRLQHDHRPPRRPEPAERQPDPLHPPHRHRAGEVDVGPLPLHEPPADVDERAVVEPAELPAAERQTADGDGHGRHRAGEEPHRPPRDRDAAGGRGCGGRHRGGRILGNRVLRHASGPPADGLRGPVAAGASGGTPSSSGIRRRRTIVAA